MNFLDNDLEIFDNDSRKSFTNYIREFKNRDATIVCGAGLSVSAGLPTWNEYLKIIVSTFLIHWKELEKRNKKYLDKAPSDMSINLLAEYYEYEYPNFTLAQDFLYEDPLILAQLVKNCIEPKNWKFLLRKALYGDGYYIFSHSKLVDFICHLVSRNKNFTSIITYNYDDFLETTFAKMPFKTSTIISENYYETHNDFPIYHMHGILPHRGGLDGKIYLSEEDYLTDIIQPNSWYNQLHANKLTSTCCLFIGLSFNDPSLKRKLAIHRLNPNEYHYALLTHKETEFDRRKFLLIKNELLRLNVRVIAYPYDSNHENLNKVIKLIDKYINPQESNGV